MQVDAGVNAAVVAARRARRDVGGFFNKHNAYVELGKFARNGATRNSAANDKNVGRRSVYCGVVHRRNFDFFAETFESDVVENAQRTFGNRGHAATVNAVPIVKFAREPYATAVLFDVDGRGNLMNLFPNGVNVHLPTSQFSLNSPLDGG